MSIITRYLARKSSSTSPPASSLWLARSTLATTPVCATTSESSQKFKWSHRSWSQRCRWWTKPPGLPNGNAHCTYLDIAHFCLFFFLSQILDYGQGSERSTAEPTNHCCRLLCRAHLWQVSSTLMPIPDISWPFTPLWQVFEKASDSCELGRLPPSQYHLCRQCLLVLRAQGVSTKTTQSESTNLSLSHQSK